MGASWMGVMQEGSTMGFGLLAVSANRLYHCWGRPVNFCSCGSNPVCTLCSKLEGPDISIFFFFFPNMMQTWEMQTEKRLLFRSHQQKTIGKLLIRSSGFSIIPLCLSCKRWKLDFHGVEISYFIPNLFSPCPCRVEYSSLPHWFCIWPCGGFWRHCVFPLSSMFFCHLARRCALWKILPQPGSWKEICMKQTQIQPPVWIHAQLNHRWLMSKKAMSIIKPLRLRPCYVVLAKKKLTSTQGGAS